MTKRSHTAAPDAIAAARAAAEALDEKSGEDIALLDLSDLLVVTGHIRSTSPAHRDGTC